MSSRLVAIWITGFCAFLNLYAPQSLLPTLSRAFHVAAGTASLTITASTIAVAISAPFMGFLADAVGRRRLIVASLVGLGAATLLTSTADTLPSLVAWRFAQGICLPGAFTGAIALVGELWPERVGSVMAGYVTATVVGGFTGRFASGAAAEFLGWRWAFVVLGLLTLVGAGLTAQYLPASPGRGMRLDGRRGTRALLADAGLRMAYVIGFMVLFSLVATFTYVTFYLAAPPFHLGPAALGSIFAVYLVGVVVTPLSGRWIDRFGYRAALMGAVATGCLGVLLALSHGLPTVLLGLTLLSCGVFVAQSSATGYVAASAGEARGAAAGLYMAFYYSGGSLGAVLPGALWAMGGWPACVALVVAVQVATLVLAGRHWRSDAALQAASGRRV